MHLRRKKSEQRPAKCKAEKGMIAGEKITLTNCMSGLFSASFTSAGKSRLQAIHQGAKKSTTTSLSVARAAWNESGSEAVTRFEGRVAFHLWERQRGYISNEFLDLARDKAYNTLKYGDSSS